MRFALVTMIALSVLTLVGCDNKRNQPGGSTTTTGASATATTTATSTATMGGAGGHSGTMGGSTGDRTGGTSGMNPIRDGGDLQRP